jgi:hypothetical protein
MVGKEMVNIVDEFGFREKVCSFLDKWHRLTCSQLVGLADWGQCQRE